MIRRLFHAFGKRRRKERSSLYRYANRTLTVVGIAYLLLLFFPSPLFAYSKRIGQFEIYSDRSIPKQMESVIEIATARLEVSPLYDATDTFHIYIASDAWRRRLLNPRALRAFGASLVFTGNTIVNRSNIEEDLCNNDRPRFSERPLHAVIAHECMHHLIADKLGLISYFRLPEWKNEGYCEYVAGGSSFPLDQGLQLLRDGRSHESPAFRYLTFLLAVRYNIEDGGMTPNSMFMSELDFDRSLRLAISSSE